MKKIDWYQNICLIFILLNGSGFAYTFNQYLIYDNYGIWSVIISIIGLIFSFIYYFFINRINNNFEYLDKRINEMNKK